MSKRYVTAEEFKAEAKEGRTDGDMVVRTAGLAEVKAVDGDERAIDFVISTDSLDRHGDRISQDGWKLDAYRKNPVVCWAHDYESLPVARAKNIRVEDGKLKARAVFTEAGMVRFNDIVFEMCRTGFLNAASVGFVPRKWNWAEDEGRRFGMDFEEQELLEFSVVPVPANGEALIEARGLAGDLEPMRAWCRKFALADDEQIVKTADLESMKAKLAAKSVPLPPKFPRVTSRALDLARLKKLA